jgi:RNA polymerase sigma-70 factor (ECF subfamily)
MTGGAANFPDFPFSAPAHSPSHTPDARSHAIMQPAIDRDTFDQLVSSHLSAAHRFAIRLAGDVHVAEDLVQEALYRAARGWQGFRGQAAFKTWLFQIVVNVFRDQLGKRGDDARRLDDDLVDARSAGPADEASAGELGPLVAALVSALPPRQREVLVLVAYEGLTPAQASAVLEISETNARANLAHARQRLKEQLAPYMDPNHRTRT